MDGIGIAGLALAVFDQLLKLGERTAETVQDLKGFQEVISQVCRKPWSSINRHYRTLETCLTRFVDNIGGVKP